MGLESQPRWRRSLQRARRLQLGATRLVRWLADPELAAPQLASALPPHVLGEVRAPLVRDGVHPALEAGKRTNVALAAVAFHGLELAPDRPLSFWRTLGPATARRGFVAGVELRGGCAVPAIGGGLCLISNALFRLAVELGWDILERHAHTQAVGDVRELDATVAFPHVDLRVRPRERAVLEVQVTDDALVVAARADAPQDVAVTVHTEAEAIGEHAWRVRIERTLRRGDEVWYERIADDARRGIAPTRSCLDCEVPCGAGPRLIAAARLVR